MRMNTSSESYHINKQETATNNASSPQKISHHNQPAGSSWRMMQINGQVWKCNNEIFVKLPHFKAENCSTLVIPNETEWWRKPFPFAAVCSVYRFGLNWAIMIRHLRQIILKKPINRNKMDIDQIIMTLDAANSSPNVNRYLFGVLQLKSPLHIR